MSDDVRESLEIQAIACRRLGSAQYADLLEALTAEHLAGGLVRDLLDGRSDRPVHDALPLRLLGAVHRIALDGRAPALARRYASCGGDGGSIAVDDFLAVVESNRAEVERGLGEQVQTNEVGRSIVLRQLSSWLAGKGVNEFDLLEVGSSAGLNLNFDRLGELAPDAARCVERRGSDPFPLDPSDDECAKRLLSFVWPDQIERLSRLRTAIDVARRHPQSVSRASADDFLRAQLATESSRATVVFHSIVWQYLDPTVRDGVRAAIFENGGRRDSARPIVWARMEPAGETADVRVTIIDRDGRRDHVLATVGYHGQEFRWLD